MMKSDSSHVLVIHPGTLGDVLLALQAIRGLRRRFPSCRLALVSRGEIGSLLLACHEVDETLPLERRLVAELFLPPDEWNAQTKEIIRKCHRIVCWMNSSNKSFVERLQSYTHPSIILQSPTEETLHATHTEDRFLETLQSWMVVPEIPRRQLKLFLPPVSSSSTITPGKVRWVSTNQTVVIHPGSGSFHKCLGPVLLSYALRTIAQEHGMKLVIVGGPSDALQVKSLVQELHQDDCWVVQDQDLISVAKVISYARLFIGHDSGLTHLAAALGVPTVVLFGPTKPEQWSPRGNHVAIAQGRPCHCSDWKQVQECHQKPCLNIPVEVIMQKVEIVLRRSNECTLAHS